MNVPMIAMITQIPVVMSVTISIAVFLKTITHSNHLLKLEIMIAASWLLATCVCLSYFVWQPRMQPATTASCIASERVAIPRNENNPVFLAWLHFYNPHLIRMCSHTLLEFTYNFGGLMQGRRSSMANTLEPCLCCICPLIRYLLSS